MSDDGMRVAQAAYDAQEPDDGAPMVCDPADLGPQPQYRLMPILERLGACNGALQWLRRRRFATFRDAYEAADADHARWLVCRLWGAEELPWEARNRALDAWVWGGHVHKAVPWQAVEAALVEYARRHGCLVKVRR